ncbi:MAG: SGNH/GDSL hydrolase family protein [Ardenticatenales bacterium]|nr:SGNH/GDSL hydrolase family protein [Ardenticatenales bacterium]
MDPSPLPPRPSGARVPPRLAAAWRRRHPYVVAYAVLVVLVPLGAWLWRTPSARSGGPGGEATVVARQGALPSAGVDVPPDDRDGTSGETPAGPSATPSITPTPSISPTPSDTPTPTLSPTPTDTPSPTLSPTPSVEDMVPIVPGIDQTMKDRLRGIVGAGQGMGRRSDVLMKVGDSLTDNTYFLGQSGCGWNALDAYADLQPVIDHYRAGALAPELETSGCAANSLTRISWAANSGWTAAAVFGTYKEPREACPPPDDYALACELRLIQPGAAVILFGTNDAQNDIDVGYYESTLRRIVDELAAKGVVPLLTTIPPRLDRPNAHARITWYNQAVVRVAQGSQVPLINLWRALWSPDVVNAGMAGDGIHLNTFGGGPSNFTPAGLRYGVNQRNLITLQALARLKRVVFDDGPPEP